MAIALMTFVSVLDLHSEKADPDDQPPAGAKTETAVPSGVTVEEAAQEHLGLKVASPTGANWQPDIPAMGRVANPLTFLAAVTDYQAARAESDVAKAELARTEKLAAQENASPRALEAARATVVRDDLALQAARAKFAGDWGSELAGRTNLAVVADEWMRGEISFIKLSPPVGVFPNPPPAAGRVEALGQATTEFAAEFADNLAIDPTTQVETLLYLAKKKLPAGMAVTARLLLPGESTAGLEVPAAAVLRYQGLGWVYVQTSTNHFERAEIPLDRPLGTGWFVSGNLAATNQIVVTGAQSLLSVELSSGGFTTGGRD